MSTTRNTCEWTACTQPIWAPYSWKYCPLHFAKNALRIDQERKAKDLPPIARMWARSRFSAVINGFEPGQGYVNWPPRVPMSLVLDGAEIVGIKPESANLISWRHAEAVVLAEANSRVRTGSFYGYRLPATIPMKQLPDLDDGAGTRARTSTIATSVDEDYNGWKQGKKYAAEYYSSNLDAVS